VWWWTAVGPLTILALLWREHSGDGRAQRRAATRLGRLRGAHAGDLAPAPGEPGALETLILVPSGVATTAGESKMATVEELCRRIEELEARVRAAEDVQAIHRLKARYAQLVDARYLPRGAGVVDQRELEAAARAIAETFTEDGVWDGGAGLGLCRGREEIFERMCKPTLSFSWHFFLKPIVLVDGDRARQLGHPLAVHHRRGPRDVDGRRRARRVCARGRRLAAHAHEARRGVHGAARQGLAKRRES